MTRPPSAFVRPLTHPLAQTAFLFVTIVLWSYWTTLGDMATRWSTDPQYSHGYLVPVFAIVLLWMRRGQANFDTLRPSVWGLPVLLAAAGLRLAGTHYHFIFFDHLSLLPMLAGLCLLSGGRQAIRWAWPALGFLGFMIPLPHTIALALSGPMQTFATNTSTYFLQVLGRPALAEGNVILLNDVELGIVEACSGLRMLVVFFALSTALALIVRKPLWERLLVAASALPIALCANVLRITITGLLYDTIDVKWAHTLFHDLAGWLMMPLALILLGLELYVLKHLMIDPPAAPALVIDVAAPRPEARSLASLLHQEPTRRERRATALSSTTTK